MHRSPPALAAALPLVLDVTDEERTAASLAAAERLGLGAFFDEYRRRTGSVGVLRGDSRETVAVLKGETDVQVYLATLAEARGRS